MSTRVTEPERPKDAGHQESRKDFSRHIVVSADNTDREAFEHEVVRRLVRLGIVTWNHKNIDGEHFYVRADIV